MQDIYRVIDKYPMWMFGTTHIGQHKDNLFKEAYGKGVIELLKMVHRQADTERDEFQLVFAEHRDFRIGRIARYCEKMKLLLPKLNGWSSSRPQTCLPLQLSDLGACPNSGCSILSESDSSLGYEQVFSLLEYRSNAAAAAECAGLRAERRCLPVYR